MSNLFICKHNGLATQTPTLARLLPSHLPPLSSFPALWLVLVSPYSPLIGLTTDTFQDSWHQSVREDWSALVFSPDFISWRFAMSWHVELTRRQYTHVWLGEKVCFKDESWIKINWQPRLSKNNHVWEYCDRNTDDLVLTLAWSNKRGTEENEAMLQFISLNIPAIMVPDSWAPAPSAGHVPLIIRHNWQFSVWDFPRNIV